MLEISNEDIKPGDKVFVYGTLKRGESNHALLSNEKFLGGKTLRGFEMYSLGGFPGVKESILPLFTIKGEVFEIKNKRVGAWLDWLEGFNPGFKPTFYSRRIIEIKRNDFMYIYIYEGKVSLNDRIKSGVWKGGIT